MAGTDYRDLFAWQTGMKLAEQIYRETASFPAAERFGLARQLQRAAVSIPSNVAEGQARQSRPEFRRFLRIARGSLAELETQIELASRLGFLKPPVAKRLMASAAVGRIVSGLIRSQADQDSDEPKRD